MRLPWVLDTGKKTILHIPNVNAGESTKDKHKEVDTILDIIGTVTHQDPETGVIFVKCHGDGKTIKVADLVNDTPKDRDKIISYLRRMDDVDDMDLIIALGMAREGFDWPFCEHALTVGYRGSLTEIIQIIGRATRDSSNKTHSQFTNLIAQPDAADDQVKLSVNNMLKAISASLLMEQVLAPNFRFKTRRFEELQPPDGHTDEELYQWRFHVTAVYDFDDENDILNLENIAPNRQFAASWGKDDPVGGVCYEEEQGFTLISRKMSEVWNDIAPTTGFFMEDDSGDCIHAMNNGISLPDDSDNPVWNCVKQFFSNGPASMPGNCVPYTPPPPPED